MSLFERSSLVLIAVVVVAGIIFSYREFTEPQGPNHSDFDESIGTAFRIGQFDTLASEHGSGTMETNCEQARPILVAVLHDITVRLEELGIIVHPYDTFEVNQGALSLFCNTQATATLADSAHNQLLLEKLPFTRSTPPGRGPEAAGTDVRINATVIAASSSAPVQPTTYGEELIPDAYLK